MLLTVKTKSFSYMIAVAVFWLVAVLGLPLQANAAMPNDILGTYQTYDDKTNAKKALIEMVYDKKRDSYYGRIKKVTPVPGYKPKVYCVDCPKPFTGKKIEGLVVIWNLKPVMDASGKFSGEYDNGYVLDPLSGKIYKIRAARSSSGRLLKMRAYKGITLMGRTQSWLRVD